MNYQDRLTSHTEKVVEMKSNTNIHTIVLGLLDTPPYDRIFEIARRVYDIKGLAPACHTCGGG